MEMRKDLSWGLKFSLTSTFENSKSDATSTIDTYITNTQMYHQKANWEVLTVRLIMIIIWQGQPTIDSNEFIGPT